MGSGACLNPSAADCPTGSWGKGAEEEQGEDGSPRVSSPGSLRARPGASNGTAGCALLEASALLPALSLARVGCAGLPSRELMMEKSFEIPAHQTGSTLRDSGPPHSPQFTDGETEAHMRQGHG